MTEGAESGETPAPGSAAGLALLLAACGIAWACARPGQPPGAPDETEPPGIRSLSPARDTVVPELSGRATIQFDEPISAGSGLQQQLVASPAYPYSVTAGHSEISVRPEGGWRPGAVYVLELPAGISDLLNNAREEPIRMVFSTGPRIVPTRVRARLFDRVTGEEQTDGRVVYLGAREEGGVASVGDSAVSAEDTVPYTSVADTGGVYRLRHLPPGDYWAYGFVDRNRNRRLDRRLEPYDSARVVLDSDSAAASVRLFTLEPDSTAPVLGRIETPDSVTLRLGFDDHLRPGRDPDRILVRREGTGDSLPIDEARVLTAADTLPSDTAAADTAAVDTLPPGPEGDAARDTAGAEMPPRPTRMLRVRLGAAMAPGDTFRVGVRGVANVRGLTADADTAFVFTPPPDTVPRDTAGAAPDSVPSDTTGAGGLLGEGVQGDSVPPDTAGALP